MKTAIIALTKNGGKTAVNVKKAVGGEIFCRVPPSGYEETKLEQPLKELMSENFHRYDRFVMIMATGIVVRTIAPLLQGKDRDPAIVVLDEKATFAISLLSGHLGGANDLAAELAEKLNATAVITTATDVNNVIAFDMVAKENGCVLENLHQLAKVSGKIVNGETVFLRCDVPIEEPLPPYIILCEAPCDIAITNRAEKELAKIPLLRPKNLILGVGCRKNTPAERLKTALEDFLRETGYAPASISAMVSVDLKAEEPGLLRLSDERGIPFFTYPAEALKTVTTEKTSAFVAEITGTPSVAEAAARYHTKGGKTVVPKTIFNGITFSLAETPVKIKL